MKYPAHVSVTQNIYFSVFCACRIERKSRSSLIWPQFLSFFSFNWQREVDLVWLQLLSQPPRAEGTLTTPAWEGIVGRWGPATLESQGGFSYPKKLRLAYLPNNSFVILFIFFFFLWLCQESHNILQYFESCLMALISSWTCWFISCVWLYVLSEVVPPCHENTLLRTARNTAFILRWVVLGLFEFLSSARTRSSANMLFEVVELLYSLVSLFKKALIVTIFRYLFSQI